MKNAPSAREAFDSDGFKAAEELLPLVYEGLRSLAAARMANETPGQTLQPTALVHEAWLRLSDDDGARFESRAHFFSATAEAMRRILIDKVRQKLSAKRGARPERVDLDRLEFASDADDGTLLVLDEALRKLTEEDSPSA